MRHVHLTTVNVVVNDHCDRTNVVMTVRTLLQRVCLWMREACPPMEFARAKSIWQPGFGALALAPVGSPSWGGHRWSGWSGSSAQS